MYFKTALKSKTLAVNKQWWFDWMRSKRSWFSSNAESSSRTGSKTRSSYPVGKTWERFLSDPKEIVEKILSWSIAWRLDWPGTPLGHLDNNRGSVLAQLAKKFGNLHGMISKKTLRWMKNQEDLALDVSKASVSQPSWCKSCLRMSIIYFWSFRLYLFMSTRFRDLHTFMIKSIKIRIRIGNP